MNWNKGLKYFFGWLILAATGLGIAYASAYIDAKLIAAVLVGILLCGLILKNPLFGLYLLIFFLPFERIGSIDVSGITVRISQLIAILTIGAWIVRGFAINKFKLRPNPLMLPIGIFLLINVIALLNTPNLKRSLIVLTFTSFTILVSLAVPNILRHKDQFKIAMKVLLASMIVVGLFGIFQFLGDLVGLPTTLTGLRPQYTKDILGFPRVQSTALEPLYFANYLLIPLGVAASLFLSKASKTIRPVILLGVVALGGINLVLTVSRGGYIAFAAMLAVLGVMYWREVLRPRSIISAIVITLVVGLVAVPFLNVEEQLDTYTEHVGNIFGGASFVERVDTFETAFEIWNQHPLIGIGPGGFGPYTSYHPLITPSEGFLIVNNEYIELLAETGILGLLAYGLIIFVLLVRTIKSLRVGEDPFLRAVLIGLIAAMVGILVQYNTFSVLYIMHIWFTIGSIIAVQNLLLGKPDEKQ